MSAPANKVTPMRPRIRRPAPGQAPDDEFCIYFSPDSMHDLSSPIGKICSLSELLVRKHEGALDEEAKVLFGLLQQSARQLETLMDGLRMYVQIAGTPPTPRLVDGNALLAGARAMLQHPIEQTGALLSSDQLPELWCDPAQMTYVLASLIDNSIKFRAERRPEVHVGAAAGKKTLTLRISDNGQGIDPRYAGRVFAAFTRIHSDKYPGSGIGLAIARRLVALHKGRIWFESELGRGATFFVELPKVDGRGAKTSAPKQAAA